MRFIFFSFRTKRGGYEENSRLLRSWTFHVRFWYLVHCSLIVTNTYTQTARKGVRSVRFPSIHLWKVTKRQGTSFTCIIRRRDVFGEDAMVLERLMHMYMGLRSVLGAIEHGVVISPPRSILESHFCISFTIRSESDIWSVERVVVCKLDRRTSVVWFGLCVCVFFFFGGELHWDCLSNKAFLGGGGKDDFWASGSCNIGVTCSCYVTITHLIPL